MLFTHTLKFYLDRLEEMETLTYPLFDFVLSLHFGFDPFSRHVRGPEPPGDQGIRQSHDQDRQEVQYDGNERVVERLGRIAVHHLLRN